MLTTTNYQASRGVGERLEKIIFALWVSAKTTGPHKFSPQAQLRPGLPAVQVAVGEWALDTALRLPFSQNAFLFSLPSIVKSTIYLLSGPVLGKYYIQPL